ncbi:hypothetical protein THIOM_002984 [Candidatus Thiomargarita nelsonii]|uniref:Uncharacterized protein n=1 Tax=Candidatus Thiomargarita nelsonii TaxID=1003181 RepID=A0A176RZT0_9GAMM|nr:hypothetical protein THIOM_002984 [Candidatus Thiomargarita nelsonii]
MLKRLIAIAHQHNFGNKLCSPLNKSPPKIFSYLKLIAIAKARLLMLLCLTNY